MADFLTWVEIPGKPDIYILTDNEIFIYSTMRNSFFDKFKNGNDILGSDAIIEYFKLNKNRVRVRTVGDFWNIKRLPQKLADMVSKFGTHWLYCLQNGFFRSSQLLWFIEEMPENKQELKDLKNKFWDQICRQKVKIRELASFLEFSFIKLTARKVSNEWKEKIAFRIIDQTKEEVKIFNHYYLSGDYRKQKTKPPDVDLWGLTVIKMIFDGFSRIRKIAEETETNFKRNKIALARNIKRR